MKFRNPTGWTLKHSGLCTLFSAALLLSACGSSSSDDAVNPAPDDAPPPSSSSGTEKTIPDAEWPEINVYSREPKVLQLAWTPVEDATHYRLLKDPDGNSGFSQIGDDLTEPSAQDAISVHRHDWANARYIVKACDANDDCQESNVAYTSHAMLDTIGYFKASNTDRNDWFGWSLALSGDGQTLAVGATQEASNAQGIDGDQSDNSLYAAGAVYVFTLENGEWVQDAYVKASNTKAEQDRFGYSVALSDDGTVMAVGAIRENSNATGINGDQSSTAGARSGAVYAFARSDGAWSQTAYIKPSNTMAAPEEEEEEDETEGTDEEIAINAGFHFGHSVALSGDGLTLAVGAIGEASAARGIDGDQTNRQAPASGAVYVFTHGGDNDWSQQAYVKASNTRRDNFFGWSVALSESGNTLAVGAPEEGSNGIGVEATQNNNRVPGTGAVYVFTRSSSDAWSQQSYIKPAENYPGLGANFQKRFGTSVSLSANGDTLAVGAPGDLSVGTGPGADPADYNPEFAFNSGAVYLYSRNNNQWAQADYLKASNNQEDFQFGRSLALSANGQQLLVGAWREDGWAPGINGDETDQRTNTNTGAAYLFSRGSGGWQQDAYIKAPNPGLMDSFGVSAAISNDGDTLAIGAHREKSTATGINGNRDNRSGRYSGAVYLY